MIIKIRHDIVNFEIVCLEERGLEVEFLDVKIREGDLKIESATMIFSRSG